MSRRNKDKRIQNQHRKQQLAASAANPSDAVVTMLSSAGNPLVAITLINPTPTAQGIALSRSVGCVTELLGGNLRLVMTCRHAFANLANGYRMVVAMKNPKPTILGVVGSPIEDPEPESDVAFLLVRDPVNAATQAFALTSADPPTWDGMQTMYNAANKCDPPPGRYEMFVARQATKERPQRCFSKLSTRNTEVVMNHETVKHVQLHEQGWISCRMFQMHSRPGFSGSPVWDEQLNLYGMDVRGTSPGDGMHENMGDVLVCLPKSHLYAARQRVEPLLQQLLISL